jgi:hypothetical protein
MKKKAQEIVALCNVDVAIIVSACGGRVLMWPSKELALATCWRFNALPPEEQERNTENAADLAGRELGEEVDKLVRAQDGGVAGALGSWDGCLEAMTVEKLRELLTSIDASLAAAESRALKLVEGQPQSGAAPDCDRVPPGHVHAGEVTAGSSVSVRASGASNRVGRRLDEADAGGDVSAPVLEQTPGEPNAASPVAYQVTAEDSVPAPAGCAWSGVPPRPCEVGVGGDALELPQEANPGTPSAAPLVAVDAPEGGDESEGVQFLPVPSDDDDAEWTRSLVEALKESSTPSNAGLLCSETEYLYMGGGAIERDAYDFICFDLGMPPPCIAPTRRSRTTASPSSCGRGNSSATSEILGVMVSLDFDPRRHRVLIPPQIKLHFVKNAVHRCYCC